MITNDIKIEKREQGDYEPLPENIYQVELLDINDEEKPTYDTRNKPDEEKEYETVLNFRFVLLAGKDKDTDLRGRNIFVNYVPTYLYIGKKGKNKLYQITESLLGHELTPEEEATIDKDYLNNLIGKQCRIGTKNQTKNDKVYSNADVFYFADQQLESLSDEEKEKQLKPKEESQEDSLDQIDESDNEINPEDIPFN